MEGKYLLGSVGIVAIAAIEAVALFNQIDGAYLSAAIGAIAAIVGGVVGFKIGANTAQN